MKRSPLNQFFRELKKIGIIPIGVMTVERWGHETTVYAEVDSRSTRKRSVGWDDLVRLADFSSKAVADAFTNMMKEHIKVMDQNANKPNRCDEVSE